MRQVDARSDDGILDDVLVDRYPPTWARQVGVSAAKWGMAGLLLAYAGLGSYSLVSALGQARDRITRRA